MAAHKFISLSSDVFVLLQEYSPIATPAVKEPLNNSAQLCASLSGL